MDYTFTVRRTRQSATQGMATVYLNGIELAAFGDTIEQIEEGCPYYGELIGNWASAKSDGDFIHGVLFHPYDDIYHHSNKAREILKGAYTARAAKEARPGRMFIDIDAKIATARSQEERDAWEEKRQELEKYDFCAGWHVGIYKQACGHWEVLQSPIYGHHKIVNGRPYSAEDADRELREESSKRKCTRCICGWRR